MDYYRSKYSIESDRISVSSLRDGSLTSDLDDLTVIAEFDNYSEYDDDISTYRLSPTYEVVGCSVRRRSSLKQPPKICQDSNVQTDDSDWRNLYNTQNNRTSPRNRDFANPTNTNNNNSNLIGDNNSSNNSTLRNILGKNEIYDTDDFNGVVENNLNPNRSKFPYKNSCYLDEVDHKPSKPPRLNNNNDNFDINSSNKYINTSLTSTGTDPIDFDISNETTTPNAARPNAYFNPSSNKNSTSFYVPLEDKEGFYENGHPIDRMNLKKASLNVSTKDKETLTNPIEELIQQFKPSEKPKELKDKSTCTLTPNKPVTFNASTSTMVSHNFNQATCTDPDITNVDFNGALEKVNDVDEDVYKQMEELMKETEDLYAQLETEIDSRKQKERQYEELMKEHESVLAELEELRTKLDFVKQQFETEKKKKISNIEMTTQTDGVKMVDVGSQESPIEDSQALEDLAILQDEIQHLEEDLEEKKNKLELLSSKIDQKDSEIEQLRNQNNLLIEELKELNNQSIIKEEDEIEKYKNAISMTEQNSLDSNQNLQKVLEDTLKDLKALQHKFNQANQQLQAKDEELKISEEKVKEFEGREGGLDKIIGNLKTEINNLNEKMTEASKRTEEMENPHFAHSEHDEALMNEITRLMGVNTELNDTLLQNNYHDRVNSDLLEKYNDLRNVSSRLQTAVSPLKAKISLANKKIKEKNELLDALLKSHARSGRIPERLNKLVEESIQQQPRHLSPLSIDHVDRLEHNLINHLRDIIPGVQDPNEHLSRRTKSSNDLLNPHTFETASNFSYNDKNQDKFNPDDSNQSMFNKKLVSLFDKPDSYLFDSNRVFSKQDKTPKLKSPSHSNYNRNPVLIDTVSSYNNKPHIDSHLLLTKSLKADVLANKGKPFESASIKSFSSSKISPSRRFMMEEPVLPRSTLTSYNDVPPPRDFQIDRMEGRKRLLFCWEPPMDRATNSPVVGYELYVGGKNHASIKGKKETNIKLDLPPTLNLPSTFSLHSMAADGKLSAPSQIILHGMHKEKTQGKLNGNESVKSGDKLKLKSSKLPTMNQPPLSSMQKRMFVAFYDFKSSGQQMEVDGTRYDELSFSTGDLIETFGDVMPNGYVLGKIKGTSERGLVPANFLEKPV